MADDLNFKIKKMFRVAEDLIVIASRNKQQYPETFLKTNFHPSKDIAKS